MFLYFGWVVAAFLGGFLVDCWHRRKQYDLAKRFSRIIRYRGIRYAEIVEAVGIAPQWESRKAYGQMVRTWSDSRYFITLLFNDVDVCLGVEDAQYSISLDDMEARGFISLNRMILPSDYGYTIDYLDCGYWLYVCEPDIYLANYGSAQFRPYPRIWFRYDGKDLYTYDTAIFKIGDTTYTFNDIDVSYETSNWSSDTVWSSKSVCICSGDYIDFMDAWIANETASIKVRLKGSKDSLDFYFPIEAQADTLLMFQNFKDAGGYAMLSASSR